MKTLEIEKGVVNGEKPIEESPAYLRMSLAAAMTLGIKKGLFYRNAKLYCINLLLTYPSGCAARCAYCGLSNKREGEYEKKSFIRVAWPVHPLEDIIERVSQRLKKVKRICISQVTNTRSIADTIFIIQKLRSSFDIPVSILVSPTIIDKNDLMDFKKAGADKIGVAIDLASEPLFDKYRGKGVDGPHKWGRYLNCLEDAIDIFGSRNAGSHLVTGMGETEKEMVTAIQKIQDMGGWTHLFSFFPEKASQLKDRPMPDMSHYRRIQLARYLIDKGLSTLERFSFDRKEVVKDFGLDKPALDAVINSGEPFRTSGCEGYDSEVACNRPYGNSRPGSDIRNFPFKPDHGDIQRIRRQMGYNG